MALSTDSCEIDTQLSSRGVRDVSALFLLSCLSSYPADSQCVIDPKCLSREEAIHVHPKLLARCNIAALELSVHAESGHPTPSYIQTLVELRTCSCSNRLPERHLMLDFQLLAHKTCNESCSSRLPVVPQDRSNFRMTVLGICWLVVGLGRSIVLVCVGGRANLIGLLCVFLRQSTPQLRDFVVIERLDGSAVLRFFGLDEVAAGSESNVSQNSLSGNQSPMFIERRPQLLSQR